MSPLNFPVDEWLYECSCLLESSGLLTDTHWYWSNPVSGEGPNNSMPSTMMTYPRTIIGTLSACDVWNREINTFTVRIRRMGDGNIFSLCVSSHLDGGGYPHQVLMGSTPILSDGGTPILPDLGPGQGDTPIQTWEEGTPIQTWEGGTPIQTWEMGTPIRPGKGTPPSRPGKGYPHPDLGRGTPSRPGKGVPPIQTWEGVRGYPPFRPGKGVPPSRPGKWYPPLSRSGPRMGEGYPLLEQHSVYLLHGGQYASYVHAGGLSCWEYNFEIKIIF